MNRIAVCLSGQLRTYKVTLPTIAKFFKDLTIDDKPVEVDYFIHTWDTDLWVRDGKEKQKGEVIKDDKYVFADIDLEYITSTINLIDFKIEKYSAFRNNSECIPHWDALFYSFKQSINLMEKNEIFVGKEYDVVFKLRFDLGLLTKKFNIPKPKPREHFTFLKPEIFEHEHGRTNIDDQIFCSDSKTIKFLSSIYDYFILPRLSKVNIGDYSKYPVQAGPGVMMYDYLTTHNYTVTHPCKIEYIDVRVGALEENLSLENDLDRIIELHNNFY